MSVLDTSAWASLPEQPILEVGVTVLAFLFAVRLARWGGNNPFLNPTLIAIIVVVALINLVGVPYTTYLRGAGFIQFLLGPTVVLLAVPLYRQTALIRTSGGLIAAALLIGLPTGVLSAVGIAWVLGASQGTLLSIAPKSVTTGIAIGVSQLTGGDFIADNATANPDWLTEYIPPDERAAVRAEFERAVHTRSPYQLEHRVNRADGTVGWALSRAVPQRATLRHGRRCAKPCTSRCPRIATVTGTRTAATAGSPGSRHLRTT